MKSYLSKINLYGLKVLSKNIYIFFITLLSSFAFFSRAAVINHEDAIKLTSDLSNPLLIFIAKTRLYLEKNPSLGACVFILVLLFYLYCEKEKAPNHSISINILAITFSLIMLVGMSIKEYGDFTFLHSNYFQIVISICIFLGYMIFFSKAIRCLFDLIEQNCDKYCCTDNIRLEKSALIKVFFLLLICWLPYWIVHLPGSAMTDPLKQFSQYVGLSNWSDHHPVFSTVVYGFIMSLGRNIANDNFGVFLCALYQHILLAGSITYGIYILSKWQINKKIRLAILAFFCLHPLIAFQGQSVMKDVSYYAFILCFSITYLDILRDMSTGAKFSQKKYALLTVTAILSSLMRHNGIYCTILSMIFLLFYNTIKNKLKILILIVAVILGSSFISNSIIKYTNASPKSQGEMLSIPFQQIARCVKYHADELTPEDKQAIDEILEYDRLAERYNPGTSDPVKGSGSYRHVAVGTKFFNVWLKCLINYPSEYVKAFLCNTYSYYYPNGESTIKSMVYISNPPFPNADNRYFDLYHIGSKAAIFALKNVLYILTDLPGIGILFHQGFYTWLVLLFCTYSLYRKMKYWIIATMPLITNFLVCLASPVNGYFRYYMPIILIIPFVLAWGMQNISSKTKR